MMSEIPIRYAFLFFMSETLSVYIYINIAGTPLAKSVARRRNVFSVRVWHWRSQKTTSTTSLSTFSQESKNSTLTNRRSDTQQVVIWSSRLKAAMW